MGENLSTNYLINFITQTTGLEHADKALKAIELQIQKIYGKEVKVRGIKQMENDASGATRYVLQLNNAVQKLQGTSRVSLTGQQVLTGQSLYPFMGEQRLSWSERTGRWRGPGGRFIKQSEIPEELRGGPIALNTTNYNAQLDKTTVLTDKSAKSVGELGIQYGKLAVRAIAVIPIWMALRNLYMGLFDIIGSGIKRIVDLDKSMARIGALSQELGNNVSFLADMKDTINKLSLETGRSVEELSQIYINFAETGVKAAVAQAGLNTAVKLSIATFSDSAQVSRMLIDLYNVFGDRIQEGSNAQEKLNYIAGLFITLWKDNAGKLNEYIDALKNFSGVAKGANLDLKEMMTLVVVLHNFMQRGGMAGTQLARAFQEIPKNIKNVELFLGRQISGTQFSYFELFLEILKKLNEEIEAGRDVPSYILELFGERSQKGVLGLASGFEKLLTVWTKIKDLSLEDAIIVLNKEFERQTDTIDLQLKRFNELKYAAGAAFLEGITGATDFEKALEKINSALEKSLSTIKLIGVAAPAAVEILGGRGPISLIEHFEREADKRRTDVTSRLSSGVRGKLSIDEYKKLIGEYETGALDDVLNQFGGRNQKTLDRLKEILEMMEKGVDLEEIKVQKTNKVSGLLDDISYKYEVQAAMADRLKTLGFSEIEIEKEKLSLLNETSAKDEEIFQQRLRIIQAINKEIIGQSEILRKSFISAFEGLLKGEQTLAQSFANIGKTITDTFYTNLSEGLTERLFKMTGIGEIFGVGMTSLKQGIGGTIENAHLQALIKGGDIIEKSHTRGILKGFLEAQGTTGTATATFGGTGGFMTTGGIGGGGFTLPGFGEGGWFNQQMGSAPGGGRYTGQTMMYGGKRYPVTTNQPGMTRGQGVGAGVMGAMTGYSMYQSSRAGGIPLGQSIGGGILSGAGTTLLAIAAANAWNPMGWIIAGGLLISGILTGTLGGKKAKQTQIETRTVENRISSKIDVTNHQLEVVNRNLVALRSDIQTYILPASAYFAEKRNLEDEFSLFARRGYST